MNDNPSQKDAMDRNFSQLQAVMGASVPSRTELWAWFAAAAMGVGDASENTALAAKAADRMLTEYDKRFPSPENPT